ncbi:MAG: pantetheine-phosphate adenylyltransferase [Lachnospirales bacterium]
MKTAIYPGSFDPLTKGHENIIIRSAKLVDKLFVAPAINTNKKNLFTIEERTKHLLEFTKNLNVEVVTFTGLLANYVKANNIDFIIKGVRNTLDFEHEFQMAVANKAMENTIETILLPCDPKYFGVSSSIVKEIVANNGNTDGLVSDFIKNDIDKLIRKGLI